MSSRSVYFSESRHRTQGPGVFRTSCFSNSDSGHRALTSLMVIGGLENHHVSFFQDLDLFIALECLVSDPNNLQKKDLISKQGTQNLPILLTCIKCGGALIRGEQHGREHLGYLAVLLFYRQGN